MGPSPHAPGSPRVSSLLARPTASPLRNILEARASGLPRASGLRARTDVQGRFRVRTHINIYFAHVDTLAHVPCVSPSHMSVHVYVTSSPGRHSTEPVGSPAAFTLSPRMA
jgi:hypothetical protein